MDKRLEQTLFQGGHTEGLEMYEKMFSITSHQRNANIYVDLNIENKYWRTRLDKCVLSTLT